MQSDADATGAIGRHPRSGPACQRPRTVFAGLIALSLALAAGGWPDRASAQGRNPGDVTGSASISGIAQLETDLDNGGNFRWSGGVVAGSLTRQMSREFSVGLLLRYDYEHWSFSTPNAFGGTAPWGNINRPRVGLNFGYQPTADLAVFVAPQIEWDYETGASANNAKNYGAIVGATKVFSPTLVLGLGAGVYRQIDENKVFPFLIVNWQIDDKWRLRNPLQAGPAGGAGLELAYAIDAHWEVAGGGSYREYRFRLRDDGPTPGGIGQNRGVPLFARLSRKLGPKGRIDLHAGAVVGGRLEVADASGNTSASSDYRTAPLFAITAAFDF